MRRNGVRYAGYAAVILFAVILLNGLTLALDIDALLKQVNQELRQAEKDMFGGRTDQAVAALEPIKAHLVQAKQADPNHPKIASYENKYKKLVKDLERRTGKDLGGGTLTAAGTSTPVQLAPKPEAKAIPEKTEAKPVRAKEATKETARPVQAPAGQTEAKLPYNARRPIQNADNDLGRIDSAIEKLKDPKWNHAQLLGDMEKYVQSARSNLESGRKEAAQKGVTDHPEFDRIEAGIQAAEQKIADAKACEARAKQAAANSAGEVSADVEALKGTYDRVQPVFAKASGVAIYYNDLPPVEALIEAIKAFEKADLDTIRQQLAAFGAKYGTTPDAIDEKAGAMGYVNHHYRASYPYTELVQGMANVEKTRTVMADDLIRKAEEMKAHTSKGIHDFARLEQHARIQAWGNMASRFDPENPRVKAFNQGIGAWVAEDLKALNAKIDKAVFPKQAADAPGDAKRLVREAVSFLQQEEDKRAAEKGLEVSRVLRVVVTGPWRVFKKNILGEPIQYNLPIATAVQTEGEKGQNLARVYLGTLLTQEVKGVEKTPPYVGVTVGDSYYIRPSAVR